jgi:hypothetical protein
MPRDIKGKPVGGKGDQTMSDVAMTDMRRSNTREKDSGVNATSNDDGPQYPMGLKVHLDHESMKKMGMKEMPGVGAEVGFHGKAHVTAARAEKREGDDETRHVELQISHLGLHHKPDGMTGQDQAGSSKTPNAGKVTEKKPASAGATGKEPNYSRKRS